MQKQLITYLAIIIFFQSAFGSFNLLFEIGEVIEDFKIHKIKYNDDLGTFISKHFGDLRESHKEEHQEEHKHHKHPIQPEVGQSSNEVYVLQMIDLFMNNPIEINTTINNFGYKNLHPTFEKQKIFQPPRA